MTIEINGHCGWEVRRAGELVPDNDQGLHKGVTIFYIGAKVPIIVAVWPALCVINHFADQTVVGSVGPYNNLRCDY